MIMTVVMEGAFSKLTAADKKCVADGALSALLYADDTLIIGTKPKSMEHFLAAVQEAGASFGLQLHGDKFQLIQIGCSNQLCIANGEINSDKEDMAYLGTHHE